MRKNNHVKNFLNIWTIISVVTILISILAYLGYRYVTNSDNTYTDFLVGETAYLGTNKVGEWHLLWILLFFGIAITIVLSFMEEQKKAIPLFGYRKWILYTVLIYLPFCTHLLIYNTLNLYFLMITVFVSVLILIFQ